MPSAITHDEAARIRANLERSGRPVPQALRDATDNPPAAPPAKSPAVAKPAKAPAKAMPAKAPAKSTTTPRREAAPVAGYSKPPAAQRGAAGAQRSSGREVTGGQVARSVGTRAQRSGNTAGKRFRSILRSPSTLGGSDGGGLLLTFWLYPLALAIVQEGTKGPGLWLRAKFLNIGTQPPATTKWSAPPASDIGGTKPLASTANATPPGATPAPGSTPSAPAPGTTPPQAV